MNSHALDVLEFEEALEQVAAHAGSTVGVEAIRGFRPSTDIDRVRSEMALVGEGMLLVTRHSWSMPHVPRLTEFLTTLAVEGSVWDGETFRSAARAISSSRWVRRFTAPLAADHPRIGEIASGLGEFEGKLEAIERAITEDGAVRDSASPELQRLRREMQGARARIVARLTEFAASLPQHLQVPDASVSIREGRYVIPVRREGRGEVGGIVHGESQTGATLFVEPPLAVELMNRLRELEGAEAREVLRILRELTALLRPHSGELADTLERLVRLDTIYARARYAVSVGGEVPEIVAAGGPLRIVQGKHPLLLARGEPVVPFDLLMEDGERTLVISGPNTGGKTVLLKAVGLLTLLTQSGIVPPVVHGSRLVLVDAVFADIGDEQSIEASLSTFSAHLRNLGETLDSATAASLVLIDEIGSGTDPVEGGALARAILTELTDRGCFTVATTHLGALKLLATEDRRIVNASLQFDSDRLQPTYRLLKGLPGRSYGLAIARRLGLSEAVIRRAEEGLPEGERDIARLLLELEAREQQVAAEDARLRSELARTERLLAEVEAREVELRRREKDAERRARQQARDLLMQSRSEVEAAIREVRSAADENTLSEAARAARRRVEEAAQKQKERVVAQPRESKAPIPTGELLVGSRVRIGSLGRTGTLLEIRDSRAVVDAGGLRMQLPLDDLTPLPAGDQNPEPGRTRGRPEGGRYRGDFEASAEIDLRGLRADEVGLRLGRALDNALLAGLPSFRIIHGKGTGALRAEVEDFLRQDPRIASFRPGDRFEGGTGVTVADFG